MTDPTEPVPMTPAEMGRKGGKARAVKLGKRGLREAALRMVEARRDKRAAKATKGTP